MWDRFWTDSIWLKSLSVHEPTLVAPNLPSSDLKERFARVSVMHQG
jgi:hypothetical protein